MLRKKENITGCVEMSRRINVRQFLEIEKYSKLYKLDLDKVVQLITNILPESIHGDFSIIERDKEVFLSYQILFGTIPVEFKRKLPTTEKELEEFNKCK